MLSRKQELFALSGAGTHCVARTTLHTLSTRMFGLSAIAMRMAPGWVSASQSSFTTRTLKNILLSSTTNGAHLSCIFLLVSVLSVWRGVWVSMKKTKWHPDQ